MALFCDTISSFHKANLEVLEYPKKYHVRSTGCEFNQYNSTHFVTVLYPNFEGEYHWNGFAFDKNNFAILKYIHISNCVQKMSTLRKQFLPYLAFEGSKQQDWRANRRKEYFPAKGLYHGRVVEKMSTLGPKKVYLINPLFFYYINTLLKNVGPDVDTIV